MLKYATTMTVMTATTIACRSVCRTLLVVPRRSFSTGSGNEEKAIASLVQGPSLLVTSLHRPNPTLISLLGLRSLPFWTSFDGTTNRVAYQDPMITHVVEYLEKNITTFKDEYEAQQSNVSSDYVTGGEHDKTLHTGTWDWRSYMLQGCVQSDFVKHFPESSRVLQKLRDDGLLFEGTQFGFCFFSTLYPKSSIQPHSAPMNFRLRFHLPLDVPPNCGIRVGRVSRDWVAGKALVLDDSYEHEVWNDSDKTRVLLLVDVWHPDVKPQEKEEIIAMFQYAQDRGWIKP